MSDQNNALIVGIAQIIDYPSVYMGGPSRNSLRIAETIVKEFGADLARADRAAPPPACQQEAVTEADLAAARAEIERLTKERDEAIAGSVAARDEAVDWLAARLVDWWGKSNFESNKFLAEFIPAAKSNTYDAKAALQSMLADAERDMRQRAADKCRQDYDAGNDLTGHQYADAILALPLKYADREGGV